MVSNSLEHGARLARDLRSRRLISGWIGIGVAACCLVSTTPAAATEPIALHPANRHYLLFRGRPTILITSGEHYGAVLNRDFDYVRYLDTLRDDDPPGEPGSPENTYVGMLQFDVQQMAEALGGNSAPIDGLDPSNTFQP